MKQDIEQVRKGSRQLVRELETLKHGYMGTELTFSQCHVLYELSTKPGMNLKQLAEVLLVDKANLSRTVQHLVDQKKIKVESNPEDRRQKIYQLTSSGQKSIECLNQQAESQVQEALSQLDENQRKLVANGLNLYANALRKSRLRSQFQVRPIEPSDNKAVASIIRKVMTEFGAVGEGYSIEDPEVDDMHGNYCHKGASYYVLLREDRVVGCAGVANLEGGTKNVCELRKMYFLDEARGLGFGQDLLDICLKDAKKFGYDHCYIETLDRMENANSLYTKNGFKPLKKPQGSTGHGSCDRWYSLDL